MKRLALITITVVLSVLLLAGSAPSVAESSRGLRGHVAFGTQWAGGMDIFIDFHVREVNPITHRAVGAVSWRIWHPWHEDFPFEGWRYLEARASCVAFHEDVNGSRSAILVSRIVRKTGWGQGEPGEYAYWWLHDSETGDQLAINYFQHDDPLTPEDEFYEFFPRGKPPKCERFPFVFWSDLEIGDLAIQ
jgi:hypothetical protein